MRPEMLTSVTVTVSPDTIGVRDQADEKSVHLFDSSSGKPLNDGKPFTHKQEIAEIALDQIGKHIAAFGNVLTFIYVYVEYQGIILHNLFILFYVFYRPTKSKKVGIR